MKEKLMIFFLSETGDAQHSAKKAIVSFMPKQSLPMMAAKVGEFKLTTFLLTSTLKPSIERQVATSLAVSISSGSKGKLSEA